MLNRIVAVKKEEVRRLKTELDIDKIEINRKKINPFDYLQSSDGSVSVIAEVKQASPIKGIICRNFNHMKLAGDYALNGAAAISVITDSQFFAGKPEYLQEIQEEFEIPLLRKDFIIDELQLYETLILGGDIILLIAALHEYDSLLRLCDKSKELGIEPLVELHDREDFKKSQDLPVHMLGVNNRNLKDFKVDLNTSLEMADLIPSSYVKISESGISKAEELILLEERGFDSVLIGETLAGSPEPGRKLRELLSYREMINNEQS